MRQHRARPVKGEKKGYAMKMNIKLETVFLNMDGPQGKETVDEFTREAGQPIREFRAYVSKMINEYRIAGIPVYRSRRPCKGWRD